MSDRQDIDEARLEQAADHVDRQRDFDELHDNYLQDRADQEAEFMAWQAELRAASERAQHAEYQRHRRNPDDYGIVPRSVEP